METLLYIEAGICVCLLFINLLLRSSNYGYAETLAQGGFGD